jgi:transposase InsO family protein
MEDNGTVAVGVGEKVRAGGECASLCDDDAPGLTGASDAADGELRIIRAQGARADEDGIDAGAELHGVGARGGAGDPRAFTRWTCEAGGLRARPRKPFRPKTTRPDHAAHPSPILLAKAQAPTAPGTHLGSDICQRPPALLARPPASLFPSSSSALRAKAPPIGYLAPLGSYIPTAEGWLYLAVVLDLFSRSILGWKLADSLHTKVVTGALRRALDTGIVAPDALFHPDRGCQYSAASTRALLARHGLRQSMSAAGYCYDNAFAESAFASLKSELLEDGAPFATKAAASTAVFDYLETFYNRKRRHSSLGFQSPQAFLHSYLQNRKPSLS